MRLLLLLLFVQPSLFISPGNPPSQTNPPQPSVVEQNPGQPLPPGTVTYRNTWNQTQSQLCTYPQLPREPLTPRASNWTIVVNIPTLLFMEEPSSSYVRHTYTFYANGTFSAKDDQGNNFTIRPLLGLPPGIMSTTLRANSTYAEQNYLVAPGRHTVANVTVTYAVRHQFCEPAGLRMEIKGNASWGGAAANTTTTTHGALSLRFGRVPISARGDRAWFGNSSGVWLGFDWSDSDVPLHRPAFNLARGELTYQVNGPFVIDPVTVASTSQHNPPEESGQHSVVYNNGYYWVFFTCQGQIYVDVCYASSPDSATWSASTRITNFNFAGGDGLDVAVKPGTNEGALVFWVYTQVEFIGLTFGSDGVLRVGTPYSPFQGDCPWSGCQAWSPLRPSVVWSFAGRWVVTATWNGCTDYGGRWSCIGMYLYEAYNGNTDGSGAWSVYTLNPTDASKTLYAEVLQNEGVVVSVAGTLYYEEGLGAPLTWTDSGNTVLNGNRFAAALLSNGTIAVAAISYPSYAVYYVKSSNWASRSTITSSSPSSPSVTVSMTTDGSRAFVAYLPSPTSVSFATVPSSGPTTITGVASGELKGIFYLTLAQSISPFLLFSWMSGSSSPYSVRFASVPATVPTAATSQNSWSRPGLSPYESYFTGLSDYVSPGNGLLAAELGMLSLPGRGLNLNLALVFSTPYAFWSSSSSSTPYQYDNYTGGNLGLGWSLNLPWLGPEYLHLYDGRAYPYSWSGTTFAYHRETDFVLTKNSDGTYTLTKSGTLYQFDASKRLTTMTDATGNNTISFAYGSHGISQITDTVGRAVTFAYDANNRLSTVSSGGRAWTLGYSGDDLVSLTDPLSRRTTFQYATGINPWLISAILYPTGGKTTFAYGNAPVGTEMKTYYVTSRNVYSSPSQLTQSSSTSYSILNGEVRWSNTTMSDGVSVQGYADYNFQPSKSLMKVYSKDASGATQRLSEMDSDSAGRTNETKLLSPSGSVLAHSVSAYDSWGNVKYSRDDVGHEAWFSYSNTDSSNSFGTSGCSASFYTQTISPNIHDALLGSCSYRDGLGSPQQQAYHKYDSHGNLLETKVLHDRGWLYMDYTRDGYGHILSTTDPLGRATYFRYSPTYGSAYLTRQSILVGSQNVTTTYTYDFATGLLLSQTDPKGFVTSYSYDPMGRTTGVTYPAVGGVSASKVYLYDDTNNILTVVDENGNSARQYFDGLGRQTKVERWNGSSVYSSEAYTYNWLGNVASKSTAAGSTYTYTYDSSGRLTRATNPDATYQTTTYDDVNNIKTVTDENGHQRVFTYDWGNRLTSVKEYNGSTTYFLTSYSYDQVGNLLSVTDAKNQVTSYQYDDLNRVTKTTFPDNTFETRTYDVVGNLVTTMDQKGNQTSFRYDVVNRLTQVTYPNNSTVAYSYDADGHRLTMVNPVSSSYYTYDARNRLTNETEVIGGAKYSTLYSYDQAGNVISIRYPDSFLLSLTYDAANRIRKVGSFATLAYTVDDKMRAITFGNGEVTNYTYDSRGRPTRIFDHVGITKNLDLNYTYDGTGNVLTLNTESYAYDLLDRLASTTGPWGTITYAYDQVGNRVRMVQGATTTTYNYAPFNRLLSAGSTTYGYDANGNMVAKNDGFSWVFTYDYDNRLVKAVHAGTTVLQNVYDGNGKRIEKTEGDTTVFAYLGLNVLFEKNLNTGVATKRFYANGLQLAEMVGSTVSYLHEDHLGSIRFVSSSTGAQVFSSNYMPYGPRYGSSGTPDEFAYAGKIYDGSTGLYYFLGRFYDPTTGRFITQDSHAGTPADPMSLNRYIYARDNPLKYIDPNGHDWWNPFTWTPTQALLVGAVVALTIVSAVQLGLDPATDALDVAAVAEAASSFASAATMTGMAMTGMPVIAMTTEDAAPGVDASVIASLSQVTNDYRTRTAQRQLANVLGGTTEVKSIFFYTSPSEDAPMKRIYDVGVPGPKGPQYREMKFGSARVTKDEVLKDTYIVGPLHHDVTYDFVDDPVTGKGPFQRDLDTLDYYGIPWKVWGSEFWKGWRAWWSR